MTNSTKISIIFFVIAFCIIRLFVFQRVFQGIAS